MPVPPQGGEGGGHRWCRGYEDFHYKEASVLETVVREARAGDVQSAAGT